MSGRFRDGGFRDATRDQRETLGYRAHRVSCAYNDSCSRPGRARPSDGGVHFNNRRFPLSIRGRLAVVIYSQCASLRPRLAASGAHRRGKFPRTDGKIICDSPRYRYKNPLVECQLVPRRTQIDHLHVDVIGIAHCAMAQLVYCKKHRIILHFNRSISRIEIRIDLREPRNRQHGYFRLGFAHDFEGFWPRLT